MPDGLEDGDGFVEAFQDLCETLWRGLARLPAELRVVFKRVDIEAEDLATVARDEGITEALAWKRLLRAREQVRQEIDALSPGRSVVVLTRLASLTGMDRAIVAAVLSVVPPPVEEAREEPGDA
jgi:hypothetical protein